MVLLETIFISGIIWLCDITTVGLCAVCKIPQILRIYESRNVDGLSSSSLALELLSYAVSLSYNVFKGYPLSSYLEDPFLSIQSLVVLLAVYHYQNRLDVLKLGCIGLIVVVFYGLSLGLPHPSILPMLLSATVPMKVFSKVLQIKEIWVNKSVGNLSLVSWIINVYTCVSTYNGAMFMKSIKFHEFLFS